MADELAINAVYNTFIENPFDQRTASEVSFDVLFVASMAGAVRYLHVAVLVLWHCLT